MHNSSQLQVVETSLPGTSGFAHAGVYNRWAAAIALVILFLTPIDFAFPPGPLLGLSRFLTVGLSLSFAFKILCARSKLDSVVLGVAIGYVFLLGLNGTLSLGSARLLLYFLAAYVLGMALPRKYLPAMTVLFFSVPLIGDGFSQQFLYLNFMDGLIFIPDPDVFRARGFIGHPVPAGAAIAWALTGLIATRVIRKSDEAATTKSPTFWFIVAIGFLGVFFSGTRSAIIVLLCCSGLIAVAKLKRQRATGVLLLSSVVLLGPTLISAATSQLGNIGPLSDVRLLQVGGNSASSDSFVVRASALQVLASIPDRCGPPCLLAGHGYHRLQDELKGGYAVREQSTIDNWYIAAVWDFGLLIFIPLAMLMKFLFVRFASENGSIRFAAWAILALLLSSFFYDTLYLTTGVLMLGSCLGLINSEERIPNDE